MKTIEIPKVESLAAIGDPLEHIAETFHFLLTALVSREQALLHVEYRRPAADTVWYLRPRTDDGDGVDETVAVLPSAIVQSCAARLALAVDLDYKAGGQARAILMQAGRRHECRIFLSNCRESGYWIRVYAKAA